MALGSLYVGSFAAFLLYLYVLVVVAGAESDHTWEALWPGVVVVSLWWVIWGLLAWILTGFPKFWRRASRAR